MPRPARALLAPLGVLALGAALLSGCGGSGGAPAAAPSAATPDATALASASRIEVRIGDRLVILAEPARTPQERSRGLSERDALPELEGMLFFLDEPAVPSFVMRGMRFPLDFIWISAGLEVVDVTEDVPHPDLAGETLTNISPGVPVLYVLEVNAGVVARYGVTVGQRVSLVPGSGE